VLEPNMRERDQSAQPVKMGRRPRTRFLLRSTAGVSTNKRPDFTLMMTHLPRAREERTGVKKTTAARTQKGAIYHLNEITSKRREKDRDVSLAG